MTVWLLDLDNTLYPASCGLFEVVNRRISEYMAVRLGLPPGEIAELRRRYWEEYGLTMCGLMAHHGVEPGDYLEYVHDVPVAQFLGRDPLLAEALGELPGEKFVFTNGSAAHARSVLRCLGIEELIADVFDIAYFDYLPKPRPHGYRKVLERLGADGAGTWMADDSADNLDTARSFGITTVLVSETPGGGHLHARSPLELPGLFRARGRAAPAPRRR
ncbi:MAG: pyrimidine 5'-nucleotidase [Deltaproteobacteria bacterium]|nr:pyrimidine 5'-nucleotidase [Deltaproteobacteria bacterium]